MDYLANGKSVKYGSHGYGGTFCASIFDRYYKDNLTQAEAYEIFRKSVKEISTRFIIDVPDFHVAVIDKDGFKYLDPISSKDIE